MDADPFEGKLKLGALQLPVEHLALLCQLLFVGHVLKLASAASFPKVLAWGNDPVLGCIEHAQRFGSPEIFAAMSDLRLHGLPRKRAFDENNPTVDAGHCGAPMGKLAHR